MEREKGHYGKRWHLTLSPNRDTLHTRIYCMRHFLAFLLGEVLEGMAAGGDLSITWRSSCWYRLQRDWFTTKRGVSMSESRPKFYTLFNGGKANIERAGKGEDSRGGNVETFLLWRKCLKPETRVLWLICESLPHAATERKREEASS